MNVTPLDPRSVATMIDKMEGQRAALGSAIQALKPLLGGPVRSSSRKKQSEAPAAGAQTTAAVVNGADDKKAAARSKRLSKAAKKRWKPGGDLRKIHTGQ